MNWSVYFHFIKDKPIEIFQNSDEIIFTYEAEEFWRVSEGGYDI